MGTTRHEKSFVDFEKPYEQNVVGLKGILYFGVGLFLLIVITFFLMWALMQVFEAQHKAEATPTSPLMLGEKDRLPPEPRLQLAPGFGIDTPNGRVNLELLPPGDEFQEFHKQWLEIWKNGEKDPKTGAVAILPIEEAKKKLLQQAPKATGDPNAETNYQNSRLYYTDASAGRVAAEKRR